MKRPPESSSRSMASSAVTIGLRVNASAMAVPTPTVLVPAATAAAVTVAHRCISGTQTISAPAVLGLLGHLDELGEGLAPGGEGQAQ